MHHRLSDEGFRRFQKVTGGLHSGELHGNFRNVSSHSIRFRSFQGTSVAFDLWGFTGFQVSFAGVSKQTNGFRGVSSSLRVFAKVSKRN